MTEENSKGKVDFYYAAKLLSPSAGDYKYLGTAKTVFNDDGTVTAVFEYTAGHIGNWLTLFLLRNIRKMTYLTRADIPAVNLSALREEM